MSIIKQIRKFRIFKKKSELKYIKFYFKLQTIENNNI